MIIDITGVTSGSSPYLIYLCDWDLSSCFFITGVTTIPPIVQIDSNYYFPGLQLLKVKIFDRKGCFEIIDVPCLPTPPPNPTPLPTPLPDCACTDVCTYWQINLGAGPCIFKLFDCDGNIVDTVYFGTAGTYYVESVLQPQPFNQNCGYPIIDLGPCPTPVPTATPPPTPAPTSPTPTPISGCVEYNLTNSGPNNITFNFTPCCFTFIYPEISPLTIPTGQNANVCSTTIPTFPNTQIGGTVTELYTCPCPTPIPTAVPNIVWEMTPCCAKGRWSFPLLPGQLPPVPYMTLSSLSTIGNMVIDTDNFCYTILTPAVTSLPNVYWDGNTPTTDNCGTCITTHPCPDCYILTITNTGTNRLTIWFSECCPSITYPATAPYDLNISSSVSIITDVIPPVIYPIIPGESIAYTITNNGLYTGCP